MAYVYILTDKFHSTLYVGVTNSLSRRIFEHKSDEIDGFTKRYKTHSLVYFEEFENIKDAISREKQLKGWNRSKKIFLIMQLNPRWKDLFVDFD